jgi:hypothetical protein
MAGLPADPISTVEIESRFNPGFAPAPTSAETLRHIVDTISGDGAFIMQGILRKAADELEAANRRIAELEERTAKSAALIEKAVAMMSPKEGAWLKPNTARGCAQHSLKG